MKTQVKHFYFTTSTQSGKHYLYNHFTDRWYNVFIYDRYNYYSTSVDKWLVPFIQQGKCAYKLACYKAVRIEIKLAEPPHLNELSNCILDSFITNAIETYISHPEQNAEIVFEIPLVDCGRN